MAEKLKPCPFCGGEAHLMDSMGWPHWVWCNECGARVQSTKFAEEGDAEAIAKWNRRAEVTHVRTENKIREAFQDFFQRVDDMIDDNYSLRAADVLDLVLDRLMYNVLAILDKESPNAEALIKERGGDDDS
jgi:Lar family restriction alleviation protein